jgi:hypothetical protein
MFQKDFKTVRDSSSNYTLSNQTIFSQAQYSKTSPLFFLYSNPIYWAKSGPKSMSTKIYCYISNLS